MGLLEESVQHDNEDETVSDIPSDSYIGDGESHFAAVRPLALG